MPKSGRTNLTAVTKLYLSAGRFDSKTQARFSADFHRYYNSARLVDRIQVADLICKSHSIPLDVLTLLCCDDYRVATPILAHSPLLGEGELTIQILQGSAAEREAIAQRLDLTPVLVSHLLSFGEAAVAERLHRNVAYLSGLSDALKQRIARIGRIDLSLTGQQAMTNKKNDNLDSLVSSMEQDWYAHYQPNANDTSQTMAVAQQDAETFDTISSEAEATAPTPLSAEGQLDDAGMIDPLQQKLEDLFEETEDSQMKPHAPSLQDDESIESKSGQDDFLNESDFALLEQLGGSDWEMLDDDAIEALAGSLAKENLAQMDNDAIASGHVDWSELNDGALDAMAKTLAQQDLAETDNDALARGEIDWSTLDDEAVEALAGSLADEDMARMEADSLAAAGIEAGKMGFKIGVFDDANAPIPPLEVKDPILRAATISFRTPDGASVDETSDNNAQAASELEQVAPAAITDAEVVQQTEELTEPPFVAPQQTLSQPNPVESIKQHSASPAHSAETGKEKRKAQITLTVRKPSSADSDAVADALLARAARKVELSSATEDDWLSALAKLNRDFDTESASRATAGFVDNGEAKAPLQDGLAQEEVANEPSSLTKVHTEQSDIVSKVPLSSQEAQSAAPDLPAKPAEQKHIRIESQPLDPAFAEDFAVAKSEIEKTAQTTSGNQGFAPSLMSLDDLELIEATPDLPSATDLLLNQHQGQGAAPYVDLVEPIDITIRENGRSYSLSDIEIAPMQVVLEQLAKEKAALAVETAPTDMTELPQMSEHRLVDVEEYEKLKATEQTSEHLAEQQIAQQEPAVAAQAVETSTPLPHAPHLREIQGVSRPEDGLSKRFYAMDEETRLILLQGVLAQTMPDASNASADRQKRAHIDADTAQDLVMARFGNDRYKLTEMLHDMSGHSRVQMSDMLQDTGGEALVVFLYHIGLDEGSTLSMVLHGPDAVSHSYEKVAQLMTLYHQLYPAAAARIVRDLFGEVKKPGFVHQTIQDEGKGAASPRLRGFASGQQNEQRPAPTFGRRVPDADRA